jgi:hypothetical protein
MTRREMLARAASLAAFASLARSGDAQVTSSDVPLRGSARACIFVNLIGAPSHVDTFDVKDQPWNPPDAKLQQFAGGIVLSQTLFPQLSKFAGDLCLLRSVRSWEAAHERGQFYLQTAHSSNPAFAAETPHMGSVVALEKGGAGPMPPFIALNGGTGQGSAFLGGKVAPMAAPADPKGLLTLEHNFYGDLSQLRFEQKYKLLTDLDAAPRDVPLDSKMADHADFYPASKRLMYDPAISSVFRFSPEEDARYGNTRLGRAAIVARNAIRANNGTVFVNLLHDNWDTHQGMFERGYHGNFYLLCSELDGALGPLIADLKASGDLDKTIVVIMGEFGRTPGPLNPRGGRDHHKDAMSVAMLGGGVKGGLIIGATDKTGNQIIDPGWKAQRPIVMEDIAATVYSALGINYSKSITDTPSGRRFEYVPLASTGAYTPIEEVFG